MREFCARAWVLFNMFCRYGVAEHCAQRALVIDPKFMKARYRRGLARKGSHQLYSATLGALTRITTPNRPAEAKGLAHARRL
jgi:hypothetical protein